MDCVKLASMATKFDQSDAWEAMEAEDRAYWAARSVAERAASVLSLSSELMAVERQTGSASARGADDLYIAEKIRGWFTLKERLRCPSASLQSLKTSSVAH